MNGDNKMFKVDVFIKTLNGEWIVKQARFNNVEMAESTVDELRFDLYNKLNSKDIQDFKVNLYDESQYTIKKDILR